MPGEEVHDDEEDDGLEDAEDHVVGVVRGLVEAELSAVFCDCGGEGESAAVSAVVGGLGFYEVVPADAAMVGLDGHGREVRRLGGDW